MHNKLLAATFASLILGLATAPAQDAPSTEEIAKKILSLEDYAAWQRITSTSMSPDGKWLSYAYDPNEGDTRLFVAEIDGETVYETKGGEGPIFSEDSRFAAYMISPSEKETKKLRKKKKPVLRACEYVELASGKKHKVEAAVGFRFAENARYLAIHKRRLDSKAKHEGADLLLVELDGGAIYNIGNVSEYAFNEDGDLLAYAVDAENQAGNGLYLRDLGSGRVVALDSAEQHYSKLVWNEKANDLCCLRGDEVKGFEERGNELLAFFDLDQRGGRRLHYQPEEDADFPDGYVLSEHRAPEWSDDRDRLFFGIREQQTEVGKDKDKDKDKEEGESEEDSEGKNKADEDEPRSNVEVWHWKDERVQSTQKVRASRDRKSTQIAVLHLEQTPRFVSLANDEMTQVTQSKHPLWALGRDDSPYRGDMSVAGGRADYYRVELLTGARQILAESLRRSMGTSPDGKWFLYSRNGEVFVQEMASLRSINLSELAGVDFANSERGTPSELPSYGLTGWSKDGKSVILNHRYDLWMLPLESASNDEREDGSLSAPLNLTAGLGDAGKIRFRYVRLDPEEEHIDTDAPILLSSYGDKSKRSGYYQVRVGAEPEALIHVDKMIGRLRKAKLADRVFYTQQTFTEFPDLWVADLDFNKAKKITDANPQQAEFFWSPGRRLIDYVDERGNELQATLTLPAGYEQGKRYPMLVYFYEKMSQRHHQYSMPTYDDRPHMSTYASDGYLVLMPDIVYTPGKPGSSALDDVTSAVQRVIDLGYADPERIGLQGHSWGGYESSFIVTQSDMFACVVTGAPLTNLISMHNILYKRSGNPNAGLIEWGQGRMGTNPFENLAAYVEQSPVHHAMQISTPFMILHGTDDGAVDWNQGLEFYIAAKRLGKEVILLSYPGEPHHLRKQENQKDFQVRMKQYFDHHLKGSEAPPWLRDGLDYLDREREKR